jgi:cytochrome oxidase Cu insertion factor (SCO1/SenC/PrrC family)
VTENNKSKGHHTLLAFGFTRCLHICPMMAANMALALKISPPGTVGVFVSVGSEGEITAVYGADDGYRQYR